MFIYMFQNSIVSITYSFSFSKLKKILSYFSIARQRLGGHHGMTMDWQGAPASPSSYTVKRILRLEIPIDSFPNVSSLNERAGFN